MTRKSARQARGVFSYVRASTQQIFAQKYRQKKRGSLIEELPLVMPLSEARQLNRFRIERILTRGDYINTVQLSYLACRTFISHITSPYTNKSITDCTIIIYDIFRVVNTFFVKNIFRVFINRCF